MGRHIRRHRKGHVVLDFDADERRLLGDLAEQLRALLLAGEQPSTRRLFPTAYPDDAQADQDFRALVHDSLLSQRLDHLDEFAGTLGESTLPTTQLEVWMAVINDLRLVLGTLLDVSEDDDVFDPDAEDAFTQAVYHYLGGLLEQTVDVLVGTLPPPAG